MYEAVLGGAGASGHSRGMGKTRAGVDEARMGPPELGKWDGMSVSVGWLF